jgi:hypothetical protein
MLQAFEVLNGEWWCVSCAHLRNRQTASKREDVIANEGKTCGVFITGNGAEHTDTGFTVCATNGGKHKDKLRV